MNQVEVANVICLASSRDFDKEKIAVINDKISCLRKRNKRKKRSRRMPLKNVRQSNRKASALN